MVEKSLAYHQFFTIIDLSLTSKKIVKSLTPSLQNSVYKSIMEVYYCQSFILSQKNLSRMLTSW